MTTLTELPGFMFTCHTVMSLSSMSRSTVVIKEFLIVSVSQSFSCGG